MRGRSLRILSEPAQLFKLAPTNGRATNTVAYLCSVMKRTRALEICTAIARSNVIETMVGKVQLLARFGLMPAEAEAEVTEEV